MSKQPSNLPSPDDIQEALREGTRLQRTMDEASSAYRHWLKRAKSAGHNTRALTETLKAMKGDPLETQSYLKALIRTLATANFPVHQTDLFGQFDDVQVTAKSAEAQSKFEAETEGYNAGRSGGVLGDCRHAPGTENYIAWRDGWQTAQALLAEGKVPPPKAKPASTRKTKGRRGAEAEAAGATIQ